jgi:propionate CoA-transferase
MMATTRVVDVEQAVAAIPDGATVATDGFTMMGVAEAIFAGIADSYRGSGHPRDLTLLHASGQSDYRAGFEHFALDGLVRRVIGSHWGLMPRMAALLGRDGAEAICLPQGQICGLLRASAAGRPGVLSTVGLGTFVDPRQGGGKVNDRARRDAPDFVELVHIGGRELLLYRSIRIDVAIIRATTADLAGNCSLREEAVTLDSLALAQAAHNCGGLVICQVKSVLPAGTLAPRQVAVPGCLVDMVVPAPDPARQHRQTSRFAFDVRYLSAPADRPAAGPEPAADGADPVDPRRERIGRRAARFLRDGDVVNLGTGIPGDTIGAEMARTARAEAVTVTVESGVYGGVPAGGDDFGVARWPSAIIAHPDQFDFYDGGGLDATFVGAGQVDRAGNVNVSLLGGRIIGCGGFIDIVQSARRVHFCFTFEGRHPKFVERVDQVTFNADRALRAGQEVYYITDRAVFRLAGTGLELIEVADGVDARRDVIDRLPFPVQLAPPGAAEPSPG